MAKKQIINEGQPKKGFPERIKDKHGVPFIKGNLINYSDEVSLKELIDEYPRIIQPSNLYIRESDKSAYFVLLLECPDYDRRGFPLAPPKIVWTNISTLPKNNTYDTILHSDFRLGVFKVSKILHDPYKYLTQNKPLTADQMFGDIDFDMPTEIYQDNNPIFEPKQESDNFLNS